MIAVWWHCLYRTIRYLTSEDHRMCELREPGERTRHFCSCGYRRPCEHDGMVIHAGRDIECCQCHARGTMTYVGEIGARYDWEKR